MRIPVGAEANEDANADAEAETEQRRVQIPPANLDTIVYPLFVLGLKSMEERESRITLRCLEDYKII